jgi:predicted nucleic acid-binding protein
MLNSCNELEQAPQDDVDAAAELFRLCRRGGETIRSVSDCLVAAIAIRHDVPILHCDKDFDAIARFSDLQVVTS